MKCRFGDKTVGILKWAALPCVSPESDFARTMLYTRFSEKAIDRKVQELADRGYLEIGVSTSYAWLTDQGRAALAEVTCSR